MKTFLGSIRHVFSLVNKVHIIWCAAVLLTMLALAILHHLWRGDAKKLKLWRLLCLIPLATVAVHYFIYGGFSEYTQYYIPLYVIGVAALLPIPFAKRRIGYRVTATVVGIVAVVAGLDFMTSAPLFSDYSRMSYTDSFHALVQDMDKYYVLKEWKEVDFKELEEKYMPLVKEAEQEQDPAKFADAVTQMCNELHDGHVMVQRLFDRNRYPSETQIHEYGLAMVRLDNGDVIAVCTTDTVNRLGIEDGTVITKWNGKPVLQAAAEDVPDQGLPVAANEERLAAIILSSIGGETVEVSFIDKSGREQTVTLSELQYKHTQSEALTAISQLPDFQTVEEIEAYLGQNFSAKMLDDKCGYLILNGEQTSSDIKDILGYLGGNHKWAREMFRERLRDLKAQGMEYLVIDLRNNGGGFDEIGIALTELLTTDDYYGQGLGVRRNGKYICLSDHGIRGDGEFADLQVVALTNYNCGSAGDGTALYLSRLPNVTLAGITDPMGCNQETGGSCLLSDELVLVNYPVGLILDEEGVPNIDTAADRISRNPVEVRIPLDYDAAMKLFRDKEDYELEWAIEYLEQS